MKAIESQLGIVVLRCIFHYKKCIYQRRDAVGLRSEASDVLVNEQVPHLMNMLKCCFGEIAIAKSLTASIANGMLAP
uniref:Transposase n=1 Tax=Heterorhabditis bacteriophora TaxID=37862 RepID=A0A1I7X717_HETBA